MIDRTGLILEIFGARAKTSEGRLQVELAALTYQRSRLVRSWTHLERQRGGFGFLGGPGEAQIELDRRRIDERITRIERDLEAVKRTRGLHREAREPRGLSGDRAGRLHQCRQVDAVQPPDRRRGRRPRPAVRDARPDHAAARAAVGPGRRSCPTPWASSPTCRPIWWRRSAPRSRRSRTADLVIHVRDIAHAESRGAAQRRAAVLASLGLEHLAERGPADRVLEQARPVERRGARARLARRRGAAAGRASLGSARTGEGIDDLLARARPAARGRGARGRARARRRRRRAARLALPPRQRARRAPRAMAAIRLRVALLPAQHGRLASRFPPDAIV